MTPCVPHEGVVQHLARPFGLEPHKADHPPQSAQDRPQIDPAEPMRRRRMYAFFGTKVFLPRPANTHLTQAEQSIVFYL
jgi:hypothetical protein